MVSVTKVVLIIALLSSTISNADSPLTSVEFWRSSNNKYVLKIGNKLGKQKLNKSMFKFLTDQKITPFDKYCLVNAIGWEYKSQFQNHLLFLKFIEKSSHWKNKFSQNHLDYEYPTPQLLELGETYFLIYEYLKAMDNYADVLDVKNEILLNISHELNQQTHFIYKLIDLQDNLNNSDFCSVFESFTSYITYNCISDKKVKNASELLREYISDYSRHCDTVNIYLKSLCNLNVYKVGYSQNLEIVNYPVFVYGTMKVYDDKNQLILEEYCSGDDLFSITAKTLDLGHYEIVLVDDDEAVYNLFINIINYD